MRAVLLLMVFCGSMGPHSTLGGSPADQSCLTSVHDDAVLTARSRASELSKARELRKARLAALSSHACRSAVAELQAPASAVRMGEARDPRTLQHPLIWARARESRAPPAPHC